jgi:hypothetical protein
MADTESQSGDLNQAERNQLCEEYLARIANSHRVKGHTLLCELVEKLYVPWARRRLEAVSCLDDIEEFRRDHATYGSMDVLPLFSQTWLYRTESGLIDDAIAVCERIWLHLAIDQALQRMPQAEDINGIQKELLEYFEVEPRALVERILRDSEELAENRFRQRRDTENWQKKDLHAGPCPGQIPPGVPPPPEDWAALEYCETRRKAIFRVALRAVGEHFPPEACIAFVRRAIQSLCKLCLVILTPYEDTAVDNEHQHQPVDQIERLRRDCRNATWFFLSRQLSDAIPSIEAEAQQVYRDRLAHEGPLLRTNTEADGRPPRQSGVTVFGGADKTMDSPGQDSLTHWPDEMSSAEFTLLQIMVRIRMRMDEAVERLGDDPSDFEIAVAAGNLFESVVTDPYAEINESVRKDLGGQGQSTIALFAEIFEWAAAETEAAHGGKNASVQRVGVVQRFLKDVKSHFQGAGAMEPESETIETACPRAAGAPVRPKDQAPTPSQTTTAEGSSRLSPEIPMATETADGPLTMEFVMTRALSRLPRAKLAAFNAQVTEEVYLDAHAAFACACDDAFSAELPPDKYHSLPGVRATVVRLSGRLADLTKKYFADFADRIARLPLVTTLGVRDLAMASKWHQAVIQESTRKMWRDVCTAWSDWLAQVRSTTGGAAFGARVRIVNDPETLILQTHQRRMRLTLDGIAGEYSIPREVVTATWNAEEIRRATDPSDLDLAPLEQIGAQPPSVSHRLVLRGGGVIENRPDHASEKMHLDRDPSPADSASPDGPADGRAPESTPAQHPTPDGPASRRLPGAGQTSTVEVIASPLTKRGAPEKRKRGPKSDDSSHMRVAEILVDCPQWAANLKEACARLAEPPDGKPAPNISRAWRRQYKIDGYAEVFEAIGEKEIQQHIERRLNLGRQLLARNSK